MEAVEFGVFVLFDCVSYDFFGSFDFGERSIVGDSDIEGSAAFFDFSVVLDFGAD